MGRGEPTLLSVVLTALAEGPQRLPHLRTSHGTADIPSSLQLRPAKQLELVSTPPDQTTHPTAQPRRRPTHVGVLLATCATLLSVLVLSACGGSKASDAVPKSSPDITPPTNTSAEASSVQTTSTAKTTTKTTGGKARRAAKAKVAKAAKNRVSAARPAKPAAPVARPHAKRKNPPPAKAPPKAKPPEAARAPPVEPARPDSAPAHIRRLAHSPAKRARRPRREALRRRDQRRAVGQARSLVQAVVLHCRAHRCLCGL